jgi:hypothetical protein
LQFIAVQNLEGDANSNRGSNERPGPPRKFRISELPLLVLFSFT